VASWFYRQCEALSGAAHLIFAPFATTSQALGLLGCLTMRLEVLSVDAFDAGDHGLGAQLGDNSAEMLEVIDLKIDGQFGKIG
jgi:hypothetical protein